MNDSEARRYQIREALGKGGFGTVYRAELTSIGGFTKTVALKVLNPELQSDEDVVRRLRDEARMLGLLNHRAIVRVDGLVQVAGRWAVVMEYVEGASLDQVMRAQGPTPPRVALQIVAEVASALDAAYARPAVGGKALGLIHRDVKPANIQLTSSGDVKLLDFGVARAGFEGREALTKSVTFGSINYMSPERFELEDHHVSDVYALAATLFELLVGEVLGQASPNPVRHEQRLKQGREKLEKAGMDAALIAFVLEGLTYEANQRMDARRFEQTAETLLASIQGPRLRDWAEVSVAWVVRARELQPDELTGQVLSEAMSLGRPAPPPPPSRQSTPRPAEVRLPPPPPKLGSGAGRTPAGAPANRPGPTPQRPARRTAPPKPGTAGRVIRSILLAFILALVIGLSTVGLSFVGCCGGCGTLFAVMGATDQQVNETKAKVALNVPNDPLRPRLDALLDRGYLDVQGEQLLLWEYSNFSIDVEHAVEDGMLSQGEVDALERTYQGMLAE